MQVARGFGLNCAESHARNTLPRTRTHLTRIMPVCQHTRKHRLAEFSKTHVIHFERVHALHLDGTKRHHECMSPPFESCSMCARPRNNVPCGNTSLLLPHPLDTYCYHSFVHCAASRAALSTHTMVRSFSCHHSLS